MDQVFKNIHIIRSQGEPIRSNGPDNKESMQWDNVSWEPGFREELMDYGEIGVTQKFPDAFGGREYEKNPTYFKGRIAYLTIHHRALTPEEIGREAARY